MKFQFSSSDFYDLKKWKTHLELIGQNLKSFIGISLISGMGFWWFQFGSGFKLEKYQD